MLTCSVVRDASGVRTALRILPWFLCRALVVQFCAQTPVAGRKALPYPIDRVLLSSFWGSFVSQTPVLPKVVCCAGDHVLPKREELADENIEVRRMKASPLVDVISRASIVPCTVILTVTLRDPVTLFMHRETVRL